MSINRNEDLEQALYRSAAVEFYSKKHLRKSPLTVSLHPAASIAVMLMGVLLAWCFVAYIMG